MHPTPPPFPPSPWPLVVVGGSAGALPALLNIAAGLPGDFPGVVLVALHLLRDHPSVLPELLNRAGPLPCTFALDGEVPVPGHIYVAPPDHHLMLGAGTLRLTHGPRENQSRPSIDVLFRSAAHSQGGRVAGVLLSGLLNDGVSGLWTIKQRGGQTMVQHPEDAEYPSMPLNALRQVEIDDMLRSDKIAGRLMAWAQAERERPLSADPGGNPARLGTQVGSSLDTARLQLELEIAAGADGLRLGLLNREALSPLTCPECHGVLVRLEEGTLVRYRCHTGHAFTAAHLLGGLRRSAEAALWTAARTFDEEVLLLEQVCGQDQPADETVRCQQDLERARHNASLLRGLLLNRRPGDSGLGQEGMG